MIRPTPARALTLMLVGLAAALAAVWTGALDLRNFTGAPGSVGVEVTSAGGDGAQEPEAGSGAGPDGAATDNTQSEPATTARERKIADHRDNGDGDAERIVEGNGSPGGRASNPSTPDGVPEIKPEESDEKTRETLLADLYSRLSKAGDAATAKVVADAIEQLWLRSQSDTVDLLMERAATAIKEDDSDLAVELLDAIVKIAPNYTEAWNRRAYVHFTKKDFERALFDLQRVLQLDPRHFKAINGLGQISREFGHNDVALKVFRRLLEVHPFMDDAITAEKELTREIEGQDI